MLAFDLSTILTPFEGKTTHVPRYGANPYSSPTLGLSSRPSSPSSMTKSNGLGFTVFPKVDVILGYILTSCLGKTHPSVTGRPASIDAGDVFTDRRFGKQRTPLASTIDTDSPSSSLCPSLLHSHRKCGRETSPMLTQA